MTTAAMLGPPTGGVLLASADPSLRQRFLRGFEDRRSPVQQVFGGAEALVKLETGDWNIVFLDRELPDLAVEELMQIIRHRFPGIEVVILEAEAKPAPEVPSAGQAHSRARTDWSKSSSSAPAKNVVGPYLLPDELQEQPEPEALVIPLPGMIGHSEVMNHLYRLGRLVAPRNTTVLILGPTGTGKELVARAVHELSPRRARSFVVVNCAAIPEALLESELFGHVRGAFTGAVQAYLGRIQAAQGGTLFLDEVGELPLNLQAKLLRFLDQKEVQRLGSSEALHVDVRVVAATNRDLARRVEEGTFRDDLYYRLSAFPLELPSLDERTGDIPLLAAHFLGLIALANHLPAPVLNLEILALLQLHSWCGNVRELQQVIERASIMADGANTILPQHLSFSAAGRRDLSGEKLPTRRPL
jgi:DNA-binding NtrC family response regulator